MKEYKLKPENIIRPPPIGYNSMDGWTSSSMNIDIDYMIMWKIWKLSEIW